MTEPYCSNCKFRRTNKKCKWSNGRETGDYDVCVAHPVLAKEAKKRRD